MSSAGPKPWLTPRAGGWFSFNAKNFRFLLLIRLKILTEDNEENEELLGKKLVEISAGRVTGVR